MNNEREAQEVQKKRQFRLGVILLTAIAVWLAYQMMERPLLAKGEAAPKWRLPLADGSKGVLSLDDMAGKVVVMEFLTLGCPHCVRQQKVLSELKRKKASSDVVVVGVMCCDEDLEEIVSLRVVLEQAESLQCLTAIQYDNRIRATTDELNDVYVMTS